jgi:hypothetical protein
MPLTLARAKTLQTPAQDCKGDDSAQRLAATNPLEFHFGKSLDELVAKPNGLCADPEFGHAEAQHDFPVLALDIK